MANSLRKHLDIPLSLIHLVPRSKKKADEFGVEITEFEMECERLKIEPSDERSQIHSVALRYWAMMNAHKRYVPTVLLLAWGIVVDPLLTGI